MFKMELVTKIPLNEIKLDPYEIEEYDDELDDGRSIIKDICEIFVATKNIQFLVSGFGSNQWPVDCRFDLPTVIEQLPEIREKIRNDDYNFNLDFYEQGLEREICFTANRDFVALECVSRSDWIPNPSRIEMSKADICGIINKLYECFCSYSVALCNELAENILLKKWMNREKHI